MASMQPFWAGVDLALTFLHLKVMASHLLMERCFPCYAAFLVKALDMVPVVIVQHKEFVQHKGKMKLVRNPIPPVLPVG